MSDAHEPNTPESEDLPGTPYARAFGEGCDDRWYGLPLSLCPYTTKDGSLARAYKLGWRHMDRHYGELCRKHVRPLGRVHG